MLNPDTNIKSKVKLNRYKGSIKFSIYSIDKNGWIY